MKCHDYDDQKNCEWNICRSQICNKVSKEVSRTLVTLEIIGINRNKMAGLAISAESRLSVKVATDFLVLL